MQPPLVEKEITMLFLSAFQKLYYDRLLPSVMRSFTDMIVVGNLVDHAIKNEKIEAGESSTKPKRGNFMKNPSLILRKPPNQSRVITCIKLTSTTNPTIHPQTTNHPPTTNRTIHP